MAKAELEEFKFVHDELCNQSKWIIEGINSKMILCRIKQADFIIFLDLPRYACLLRLIKRLVLNYKVVLPTSANGCFERFNLEFLKWIWNYKKNTRPNIVNLLKAKEQNKANTVIVLSNNKEINNFLKNLEKNFKI